MCLSTLNLLYIIYYITFYLISDLPSHSFGSSSGIFVVLGCGSSCNLANMYRVVGFLFRGGFGVKKRGKQKPNNKIMMICNLLST